MRIAATADLHCKTNSANEMKSVLEGVDDEADVLLLGGDLTNMGLREEMEILMGELGRHSLPIIAVLGNHDHESDQADTLIEMLTNGGIHVLDGNCCDIDGVGFVGTKGFCGGFDALAVQPFGERILKAFIQVSIDEATSLNNALTRLQTTRRVALLHFAPIRATLEGENPELFPFLGSSLIADVLDREGVNLILHGHAHKGSYQGKTAKDIPVYNVCRFVLQRSFKRSYALFDL